MKKIFRVSKPFSKSPYNVNGKEEDLRVAHPLSIEENVELINAAVADYIKDKEPCWTTTGNMFVIVQDDAFSKNKINVKLCEIKREWTINKKEVVRK